MVEDRVTDGRRVAELLASEVTGRAGDLKSLSVVDSDPDVESSPDGARAYDVVRAGSDEGARRVARVFVHPERVRLELSGAPERALETARDCGLRARPRATTPPATVVFVESGAETKRAADLLGAVASEQE